MNGFTMLELLIVLGIFAVLAAGAAMQLATFQQGVTLESAAKDIVSALRLAHGRALLGEDGDRDGKRDGWGIRFANGTPDDIYYTFYGTAYNSASTTETIYLPSPVIFTSPSSGNNTDVIFAKLTGTTTQQYTVEVTDGQQTKTLTIDTSGRISSN